MTLLMTKKNEKTNEVTFCAIFDVVLVFTTSCPDNVAAQSLAKRDLLKKFKLGIVHK